jgi:hypothetical protein
MNSKPSKGQKLMGKSEKVSRTYLSQEKEEKKE